MDVFVETLNNVTTEHIIILSSLGAHVKEKEVK